MDGRPLSAKLSVTRRVANAIRSYLLALTEIFATTGVQKRHFQILSVLALILLSQIKSIRVKKTEEPHFGDLLFCV
jgi:hypothetical protein